MSDNQLTIPSDLKIPAATVLAESNYWLPSVNQYILVPAEGRLDVYYVGMFTNSTHAKETKIVLPFPKNYKNIQFYDNAKIHLETQISGQSPLVTLNLEEGVNQIKSQFSLPAPLGTLTWESAGLAHLPGVTLIIMPQYEGVLRSIVSQIVHSDAINVWPARIVEIPKNFKSFLGPDPLDSNTNSSHSSPQVSLQLVGIGNASTSFPEFDVTGIVPLRAPISTLAVFLGCVVFAVAVMFLYFRRPQQPL